MNIYNKYLIPQCNSNILLKFVKLFKIFLDCCFLDLLWINFLIKMLSAQMYAWFRCCLGWTNVLLLWYINFTNYNTSNEVLFLFVIFTDMNDLELKP